ncbi:MAG TPA: hypothetical protein PKX92_11085 [Edaphocola sp.]|nr:hypothetical protein [Edaphocola sp.]
MNQTDDIEERKSSHLELAFTAQSNTTDNRFYYEPMLSGFPEKSEEWVVKLGEKTMRYPIWISSMTGGTAKAGGVNKILAQAAKKFGLGMGLGSCRIILKDNTYFEDFNLRPILGDEVPFFANLGIAQIEELIAHKEVGLIKNMINRLEADGLIVHVNPFQEWLQPEGDKITHAPIDTIKKLLNELDIPLIVKEVGQGFGRESMTALLKLPLLAVDFAANGGTNFSKLELLRNPLKQEFFKSLIPIGHSAVEMLQFLNESVEQLGNERKCNFAIISGGIKDFLDGYHLLQQSVLPAVYGQGSEFLKYAKISKEALDVFVQNQIDGLLLSRAFLKIKKDNNAR